MNKMKKLMDRTDNMKIISNYEVIFAWGLGELFEKNYDPSFFPISGVIDGRYEHIGENVKGRIPVVSPEILKRYSGRKILVVSYTIYEKQVCDTIRFELEIETDFIIFSLIDILDTRMCKLPHFYAKNCEDVASFSILREMGINHNISLLEIGVCHPVIRNNTYLFYELFHRDSLYRAVLVEANPECWDTIGEYRPYDLLIRKGICIESSQKILPFYIFDDYMGHSTFDRSLADNIREERGFDYTEKHIPTITIDEVLSTYYGVDAPPDILAIDAEGLDYSILRSIDFNVWRIKVIIIEIMSGYEDKIASLLGKSGYRMQFTTNENEIWSLLER